MVFIDGDVSLENPERLTKKYCLKPNVPFYAKEKVQAGLEKVQIRWFVNRYEKGIEWI